MGDIHIKSENQSGGITAQNVNLGANAQPPKSRKTTSPTKRIFWWIFGMAGIVGAIAGVLQLFK